MRRWARSMSYDASPSLSWYRRSPPVNTNARFRHWRLPASTSPRHESWTFAASLRQRPADSGPASAPGRYEFFLSSAHQNGHSPDAHGDAPATTALVSADCADPVVVAASCAKRGRSQMPNPYRKRMTLKIPTIIVPPSKHIDANVVSIMVRAPRSCDTEGGVSGKDCVPSRECPWFTSVGSNSSRPHSEDIVPGAHRLNRHAPIARRTLSTTR